MTYVYVRDSGYIAVFATLELAMDDGMCADWVAVHDDDALPQEFSFDSCRQWRGTCYAEDGNGDMQLCGEATITEHLIIT